MVLLELLRGFVVEDLKILSIFCRCLCHADIYVSAGMTHQEHKGFAANGGHVD